MVITLLSDFGDVYPASMKGVILGIDPGANIVDISHSVTGHDVRAGAFILMITAGYFPSGTVHIAVVDPGVGTERRAIAISAESKKSGIHTFIGPDNGLLIPAARIIGKMEVYDITNTDLFFRASGISSTFHGRDIFAPVGAHISKGLRINDAGRKIVDFVDLDFGNGIETESLLKGKIVFIDTFGNIITNIKGEMMKYFQKGGILEIQGEHIVFQTSYGFVRKGEPLALIGSHGYLEIAVNQGNAARLFNKGQGDEITLRKIKSR